MNKVVAVRKDSTGDITLFKLDDGRIMNREEICDATDLGQIEGLSTFTTRDGGEAVRSNRGQDNYSLTDLPIF